VVVALNSEIDISAASAQVQWLRAELAGQRQACAAAILHRPLFTSGINGENPDVRALWRVLYDGGVELVISGHDHQYERFSPQDPDGRADQARGIRQFIAGTGGAALYPLQASRPNSEVKGSGFGVLSLTLRSGSYDWEFIPADGSTFRDSGMHLCH
jgi:acid phosphatase type 7